MRVADVTFFYYSLHYNSLFFLNLLVLTLLSVLATGMEAQTNVSLRSFSVRNGLAANQISGIDQAPNGLIWIATWNGLCCYDGYRFTTFRGSTWGEEDALSTNRIAMIHCTTLGDVWVRTFDAGLYLLDTHHGCHFVNVGQLLEKKYGTTIKARHFYGMPSGHTWITDEQGALNLRISDEHPTDVERMEVFGTKGKPLYGKYIKKVEADAKGREWLLTDLGMMCYNTGERESTTNDTPRSTALDTTHIRLLTSQGIPTENIEKHFPVSSQHGIADFDQLFPQETSVKIIAHRAGGNEAPENTIASIPMEVTNATGSLSMI